jgi:branched-subunit amino acid aminotransferase/4-amino-4-deoxychorismate lyase
VFENAKRDGIPAKEASISRKTLLEADEVFITNSLIEIMPVREIDEKTIGSGAAGPVTSKLIAAYRQTVKEECG